MRSTTPKKSGKKKPNAACQSLSRTGVRYAFFRAFAEGDGVQGFPLEEARKQAAGVMAILDDLGFTFAKAGR